jgi:diguanylate cyclase (GGDEF)-like protein
LTGLYNRYSLTTRLDDIVKRASEDRSSFVVLFIDLDRFKHFNDRLGHAAGDKILKIVAKRIQFQVRDGDVVGRLGGDEFIVVLLGLQTEEDLVQAVGRILAGIEEPLEIDRDIRINITASIGISRYPADGTTSDTLVNRSDVAMYRVKRSGGNAFALSRAADVPPDRDQRGAP